MPGYIIHLTEAKLIENRIFSKNIISQSVKEDWKELFEYGTLLPDATKKENKLRTHFIGEREKNAIIRVPDLFVFISQYSSNLTKPLVCGYFAHLYLDYMFFNKFLPRYVTFFDTYGKEEESLSEVSYAWIHKEQKKVAWREFFSEEYLYGDYTKLNWYFIDKYHLKIPRNLSNQICLENIIQEAAECDYGIVVNKLSRFLVKENKFCNDLKVFSKEELERFLEDIAEKF